MKITDVIVDYVKGPLPAAFHPTWGTGLEMDYVGMTTLQIKTDAGITGVSAGTANGWEMVVGINTFLRNQLIGKDPTMIERIRPTISNSKLRIGWPWFVESALWDIVGKAAGLPVYKLWGGFSNKMKLYASAGEILPLDKRMDYVQTCLDLGINAVKLRMHDKDPEKDLDDIRAIVKRFGDRCTFMVDANQADHLPGAEDMGNSWDSYTALRVARQLEKLNILWLEEPVARFDYEGLKMIARKVDIPLAGGEKNSGLNEFKDLAMNEGYHILQGDCTFCEGMGVMKKAAAIAEACNKLFIPHTWSNPAGLMANMQVAASLPNCPWMELPFEPPAYSMEYYKSAFKECFEIQDGYVIVPDRPGLGFDFPDGFIEQYRVPFDKKDIGIVD